MTVEPVLETIHETLERARTREGAPFDPSASPLFGKAIFVVGAPRSGTTWLHQLLATHPDVATGGEAHVFCEGVSALLRNHEDPDPHMMLSTWLPRGELLTLVRALTDGVFAAAHRPGATRVLDKTPNHVAYAADVAEVYPDAAYVHIIRDGRDSVSSQRDLWSGWDAGLRAWDVAAARWRDAVLDARRHLGDLRYHEVRYEDLVRDPEKRFAEVLDAVGLDHDDRYVEQAVEFGRAPINVRPSDARVGVRKWEGTDPRGERAVVAAVGDLLVQLGYLDGPDRDRILAERPWQDAVRDGVVSARSLAARAAARARRSLVAARATGPSPATRRAGAERFAAAVVAGRSVPLTATVRLEADEPRTGDADVAAWLVDRLAGARVAAVDADRDAAALQLVAPDGARLLVRLYGDPDRPGRVVVQGT